MDNITEIWSYLNHELTNEEEKKFEEKLSHNAHLQEELTFYRNLKLSGEVFGPGGIQEQLEEVWIQKQTEKTKRFSLVIKRWVWVALIMMLIIVGVIVILQNNRHLPKNKLSRSEYNQLLQQQKQKYQSQHIVVLDEGLGENRSPTAKYLPSIDTLLFSNRAVTFSRNTQAYQNETLMLEVFTKKTYSNPQSFTLSPEQPLFKVKLLPGFYYWRLKNTEEETIRIGRFYVTVPLSTNN